MINLTYAQLLYHLPRQNVTKLDEGDIFSVFCIIHMQQSSSTAVAAVAVLHRTALLKPQFILSPSGGIISTKWLLQIEMISDAHYFSSLSPIASQLLQSLRANICF